VAGATSSRVLTPVVGQRVTVDTLRLDVLDVQPTRVSALQLGA